MELIDNYVVIHICRFMELTTLSRFARVNKRLNHVCQPLINKYQLRFVETKLDHHLYYLTQSEYLRCRLPYPSCGMAELIARMMTVTQPINPIREKRSYYDDYTAYITISGYYKNRWFVMTNRRVPQWSPAGLTNKFFYIFAQLGTDLCTLRRRLINEINQAPPATFATVFRHYGREKLHQLCYDAS